MTRPAWHDAREDSPPLDALWWWAPPDGLYRGDAMTSASIRYLAREEPSMLADAWWWDGDDEPVEMPGPTTADILLSLGAPDA